MTSRFLVSFAIAASASTAFADETIVIEGQAPDDGARDRERALGTAPFVTVVHPDDHPATTSVADALATTAGATKKSLGGLGAFESIGVRGQAPGHTAVLIDGIPLPRIAAVTADLGRFTLDSFGEVELYRGAVPVELGGAGVGGAVNLITRLGRGEHGERFHASLGGGSFGARHARLHYGDDHGAALSSTTIGYQGATGDYTHFTDNGTPLNRSDDAMVVRKNNGFDAVDAATRWGWGPGVAGARLLWKRQGLPGSIALPAVAATLATVDGVVDARLDHRAGRATARETVYGLVEWQALRDPGAELGLGTQNRGYLTLSGGGGSTWLVPLGAHRLVAGAELHGDRFTDADRDGNRPDQVGTRAATAGSAALELALGESFTLTPAARLDAVRTRPTPALAGDAVPGPRWDVVPSPRLTALARLGDAVAVKGSAGWYVRLPTLLEMFGDRGLILGAPDLEPERGPSLDAGVVIAPAHAHAGVDRIFVQASAFATRAHDTIALVSTAGFVTRAENVGDTQTWGGELVASARLAKRLSLAASYTYLATRQRSVEASFDDKALPRTPAHGAYLRAELAHRAWGRAGSVWADVAAQSSSYLDRANLARVPARVLAGAGVRVELVARLALAATVANLADTRVVQLPPARSIDPSVPAPLADVAGFPLPGRSFYLALDWTL